MRLYEKPAHELHEMLVKKEITSVELTEDVLSRIDEVEGEVKAYLTITREEALAQAKAVDEKIARGEFLEYEEVYEDRFYGTLKEQVETQRTQGENVVFDVDVKGGCSIKQHYGDEALSLFIQPPSIEELRRRLEKRGTDSSEDIEKRLAKASYELTFADKFDKVLVNDDLDVAKAEALKIVTDFLGQL